MQVHSLHHGSSFEDGQSPTMYESGEMYEDVQLAVQL